MGVEGGDSPTQPNWEAEIARRLAIHNLDTDARNVFARLDIAVSKGSRGEQFSVEPLPHYGDYLRERAGTTSDELNLILRLSDPEAVAAFDRVVDEFNADIERINREQDFEAVRRYEVMGFDVFKQRS